MGACVSQPDEIAASHAREYSRRLDSEIKAQQEVTAKTVKLLLLGAGETGKSTVLKQMKLIYGIGFTEQELHLFRTAMAVNLLTCAKYLIQAMDTLEIPYGFNREDFVSSSDIESPNVEPSETRELLQPTEQHQQWSTRLGDTENRPIHQFISLKRARDPVARAAASQYRSEKAGGQQQGGPVLDAAKRISQLDMSCCFSMELSVPEDVADDIQIIWEDPGVQYCFSRANEFQLIDSCEYVMRDPRRILHGTFTPTEKDILAVRILTTRITEITFKVEGVPFVVVDLGGQRSERKKWIPYFSDVKAIIYLVALSSFDQTCFEDGTTNRIVESLTLFQSLAQHPALKGTCFILFMNKIDLFQEKLKTIEMRDYFPDFTDPNTYENASKYFDKLFRAENKFKDRDIYTHFTWATDTAQIRDILGAVTVALLKSSLSKYGLM
ncbi:Guanine nucleotide-binding protein G(i) subunit alpha-2 [Chytriomyces hyalinus]|nr:Guanine nucleotide-binding protein G(i) subunit alpha-2 [Chytriomyces hyalinus]